MTKKLAIMKPEPVDMSILGKRTIKMENKCRSLTIVCSTSWHTIILILYGVIVLKKSDPVSDRCLAIFSIIHDVI
jgi:hypothetical protein